MKKVFLMLGMLTMVVSATEGKIMYDNYIQAKLVNDKGEKVLTNIARELPVKCRQIPFEPKDLWEGNFALEGSDVDCKRTYIMSVGKLSPIKMDEDIDTYGELEVLEFLEEMGDDNDKLFVDARKEKWYKSITIPGAINIPFVYFTEKNSWEEEREKALVRFGVQRVGDDYDFANAKTILLFCNAIWCRQSPQMIEELIKIGYPKEKMKWYRGGLQSWTSVGLTTYRPIPLEPKIETTPKEELPIENWFEVVIAKFEKIWDNIAE